MEFQHQPIVYTVYITDRNDKLFPVFKPHFIVMISKCRFESVVGWGEGEWGDTSSYDSMPVTVYSAHSTLHG